MSLFPFISYKEENIIDEPLPLYKEIDFDFKTHDIKLVNGSPVIVEGNEAIKVWIYKALLVPRYQYLIYSWDYGSELLELIGKAYTRGLTESEASRYIQEALLINPYISEVDVNSCSFVGDALSASISVKTIYGEVIVNV